MTSPPKAGGSTPRTGDTIKCKMIREVIGKVSDDACHREGVKIGQFVRTRPQRKSVLDSMGPLCKECTTPTGQEDSRLVATLAQDGAIGPERSIAKTYFCGIPGIKTWTFLAKTTETSWYGSWCFGDTQYVCRIIGSDCEEEDGRRLQFFKLCKHSFRFTTHLTRKPGRDPAEEAEGNTTSTVAI